ncbi:hypothetical protein BVRB_6g151060 [Beta vulgaris subsp. vulgaris]|nr:hypothetical protein BVRB_6g151060 [Beta vulgaris subsp. vulgaris]
MLSSTSRSNKLLLHWCSIISRLMDFDMQFNFPDLDKSSFLPSF